MSAIAPATPAVPEALHPDCWSAIDARTAQLTAYRCTQCGTHFLPRVMTCTACGGAAFESVALAATGTLYAYTIIHNAGGVWPPIYAVGYVDFPEGVRVFGQLRETAPDALSIGAPVAVEPAVLYTRKDGTPVTCFRFHVVNGEAR